MNNVIKNEDVIKAGMYAWNTISSLTSCESEIFEDEADFASHYEMLLNLLFEEEVSE